MSYEFTLIQGDGIGPDITDAAVKVIEHAGVKITWDMQPAGLSAIEKYKDPLPQETLDSIARTKIALKGPLTTPVGKGFRSINVALRKEFDLYANVRPAKTYPGIKTLYDHIDLIIFRENLEEFYSGIEHYIDSSRSAAETIGIVTRRGCERILRYAFDQAMKKGRKKVTAVHKANILKYTSGLFLDVAREIAKEYPDLEFNDKIIDNMAMQMVLNPYQFDVIVTTNLFGDILSDLASGLVGGLGMAPGANLGPDVGIYEAVHGSAPDIAGKNLANPAAIILASVMLLEHIGEIEAAQRIERAVASVIAEGKYVTKDINPLNYVGTKELTNAILKKLDK
ncbi:MAG: isocitrate/isopropylmalate family dehydrogenase [Bacteroidota bacterium]|nr:isocitrate/isopropylmalate family dehydrogenase [Bacteroidota bacterium]MDP4193889.1 isocitrate/isopropylmalate family dehydrogenase [Bacteroidota bacterium]